jgi:hypothetical protein
MRLFEIRKDQISGNWSGESRSLPENLTDLKTLAELLEVIGQHYRDYHDVDLPVWEETEIRREFSQRGETFWFCPVCEWGAGLAVSSYTFSILVRKYFGSPQNITFWR